MCSYKDRWAAAVAELLKCSREPTYVSARYAVAVIKEGMTVSHHNIDTEVGHTIISFFRCGNILHTINPFMNGLHVVTQSAMVSITYRLTHGFRGDTGYTRGWLIIVHEGGARGRYN